MDLSTTYLGLSLPHPLITGASPLVDHMDLVRRLEDAGAAAITMHSLFEEQLALDAAATAEAIETHAHAHAEAASYFPRREDYALGPDQYLEQLRRIKAAVDVPVIASLNGRTGEGWTQYAQAIQQAGADALELNLYVVAADPQDSGETLDQRLIAIVRQVRASVTLPLAVKLSPFASSLAHLAAALDRTGVDGSDPRFNLTWHDWLNLKSLVLVSRAIAEAAAARENSCGAHFREDHPDRGPPEQSAYTRLSLGEGRLRVTTAPVSFTRVRPGGTLLTA